PSARHGPRSAGGIEEAQPDPGGRSKDDEGNFASEADAVDPGELRDGRGPARPEPASDARADRRRRVVHLHDARSHRAKYGDASARDATREDRASIGVQASIEGQLSSAGGG